MKDKVLIFIPYQDSDNFFSDGILTREFAMLYLLYNRGYKNVVNIKKPRTILDRKKYIVDETFYPAGTIESKVKNILNDSKTYQYLPLLSVQQVIAKRSWWNKGYMHILKKILREIQNYRDCLVYSDNPFASDLLMELKKSGCKIYFDVMDNFSIHPSLNVSERENALEGYRKIFTFADCISANSQQTCDNLQRYCPSEILLVKNGVFLENTVTNSQNCSQIVKIKQHKLQFGKTVGYIGKLGKRLDADLIDEVSKQCQDMLFVFVGPGLKGQVNDKLLEIFNTRKNVLHLDGIPSAFVYSILDEFDVLMIPHAVGEYENGGDPLKLYQYLTRKKPIITTPILGVDEFKENIKIASSVEEWRQFILNVPDTMVAVNPEKITWEARIQSVMEVLG